MQPMKYQRSDLVTERLLRHKEDGGPATTNKGVSAAEVKAELQRIQDSVKGYFEEVATKLKSGAEISEAAKKAADEALTDLGLLRDLVKEIEDDYKAGARGVGWVKSIGEQYVESDAFKAALAANGRGTFGHEVKLISSGFPIRPDRQEGVLPLLFRRLTVRDLLMPGRTSSNMIEYVREVSFTNAAAIQAAEGDAKPESAITFELVQSAVRTIAHWLPASKQIIDDVPQLQSFIDQRLRIGLDLVEEMQLLLGSGTGANLRGLVTAATAFAPPAGAVAAENEIDRLRLAILQAELAFYPVNGMVLHPTNWANIELTKDTTDNYLFANPHAVGAPMIWGRSVVATPAMTAGSWLVGAFGAAAQIFDRELGNVQVSSEDRDNFIKNMLTIRAEKRLALAIYRPAAFITGNFTFA